MESVRCRKPNGTTFMLRMFGDKNERMTSRGVVLYRDGQWQFQNPCKDGVVIDNETA